MICFISLNLLIRYFFKLVVLIQIWWNDVKNYDIGSDYVMHMMNLQVVDWEFWNYDLLKNKTSKNWLNNSVPNSAYFPGWKDLHDRKE